MDKREAVVRHVQNLTFIGKAGSNHWTTVDSSHGENSAAATSPMELILIALDSTAAAQGALTRYRESVSKGGKDIHAVMAPGEGGFAGQESFYGNLVAIRVRNYVAVALGTTTEEAGKAQLMELVRNVK